MEFFKGISMDGKLGNFTNFSDRFILSYKSYIEIIHDNWQKKLKLKKSLIFINYLFCRLLFKNLAFVPHIGSQLVDKRIKYQSETEHIDVWKAICVDDVAKYLQWTVGGLFIHVSYQICMLGLCKAALVTIIAAK